MYNFLTTVILYAICFLALPSQAVKIKRLNSFNIDAIWQVHSFKDKKLKPRLVTTHSSPVITKKFVIQADSSGVKAYTKDKAKQAWSFVVKSGVSSHIISHKDNIYFGAKDGFFYSLKIKTGSLNWKFFTNSENSGTPIIFKNMIYWTSLSQKLHAFSLSGKQIWTYSASLPLDSFIIKSHSQPIIYKNSIYTVFNQAHLVALHAGTGKLQWKRQLSQAQPIISRLHINTSCLFVPVFEKHLFCLKPSNGKTLWKIAGGYSVLYSKTKPVLYQFYKNQLQAINTKNSKVLWKRSLLHKGQALTPLLFGSYLVYGFLSFSDLVFVDINQGKTIKTYHFGEGLASPVSLDPVTKDLYFLSIDSHLHKIHTRS